jgi:hypothetical protein
VQNIVFKIGDSVSHTIFGEGKVLSDDGDGMVTIFFSKSKKTLTLIKNHKALK